MTHRARLAALVIDCQTDDLTEAVAFWTGALGGAAEIDPDGRYAAFRDRRPGLLLQAVDHPPRVHLDLETDDQAAEAARLIGLGAREVARIQTWIVMEAPTGHRFCICAAEAPLPDDAAEFG